MVHIRTLIEKGLKLLLNIGEFEFFLMQIFHPFFELFSHKFKI